MIWNFLNLKSGEFGPPFFPMKNPLREEGGLCKMVCSFTPYGAFTLDVKSMLIENLGGILGGIKMLNG